MTTTGKVAIGVTGLGMAMGVMYMIMKTPSTEKVAVTGPTQSINISTSGEVPLIFQFGTATVDICAKKKFETWIEKPELLEPEFISDIQSLGFSSGWLFSDGSIANYSYPKVGGGTGYNGRVSDFPSRKDFDEWGNGILAASFPSDFYTKTFTFLNTVGWKSNVVLNKKSTWAENKYLIDQMTGDCIKLCSEVITMKAPNSMSYAQYILWAKATRDSIKKYYPDRNFKIVVDQPVSDKSNPKAAEWRRNVTPTTITDIYGADDYRQLADNTHLTLNQVNNIKEVRRYFDSIVPAQIAQFKTDFQGWFILVGETHVVDNRPDFDSLQFINKSITGVYAWGRFFQMFIENQDIQPYAIQMSLNGVQNPEDANAQVISRLNTLLKPNRKRATITFTGMEGCTGAEVHEGKIHYVLVNNYSLNTYTLDKVMIDGKKKTPEFTAYHHTATNWDSPVTVDTTAAANFSIKPGVTVLNFTLK